MHLFYTEMDTINLTSARLVKAVLGSETMQKRFSFHAELSKQFCRGDSSLLHIQIYSD